MVERKHRWQFVENTMQARGKFIGSAVEDSRSAKRMSERGKREGEKERRVGRQRTWERERESKREKERPTLSRCVPGEPVCRLLEQYLAGRHTWHADCLCVCVVIYIVGITISSISLFK